MGWDFLAPENVPFSAALLIMLAIGVLELASLLMGASTSGAIDSLLTDFDVDIEVPDGVEPPGVMPFSQLLGWLGFGKVPFMILIVLLLASFGAAGFALQAIFKGWFGFYLDGRVAMLPAGVIGIFTMGRIATWLGRILPKDESYIASEKELLGASAEIIRGEARSGKPAEAKAMTLSGHVLYVLVEPEGENDVFHEGETVALIRKVDQVYQAINRIKVLSGTDDVIGEALNTINSEKL